MKKRLVLGIGIFALLANFAFASSEHTTWAKQLVKAVQTNTPTTPLTVNRDISIKEAYEIQKAFDNEMTKEFGKVSGYKVAYASVAIQKAFNIDAPTFGTLFEKQLVQNGGTIYTKDFSMFLNEAEVAFKIAEDIKEPIKNIEELMPYIKSVHVAFDTPNQLYNPKKEAIKVADVIALNCAAQNYMIGEAVSPKEIDFKDLKITMTHNDKVVYEGLSTEVMGDPRQTLLMLANHLLEQKAYLKKGAVVLSGAVAKPYFPKKVEDAKGVYVATINGLPSIKMIVE